MLALGGIRDIKKCDTIERISTGGRDRDALRARLQSAAVGLPGTFCRDLSGLHADVLASGKSRNVVQRRTQVHTGISSASV